MKLRIDGGVVVGWSGASLELIPGGSVFIEGDSVNSVGKDSSRPVDKVIDASGKIVYDGVLQTLPGGGCEDRFRNGYVTL